MGLNDLWQQERKLWSRLAHQMVQWVTRQMTTLLMVKFGQFAYTREVRSLRASNKKVYTFSILSSEMSAGTQIFKLLSSLAKSTSTTCGRLRVLLSLKWLTWARQAGTVEATLPSLNTCQAQFMIVHSHLELISATIHKWQLMLLHRPL